MKDAYIAQDQTVQQQRVLRNIAEDLKVPLLRILSQAQLGAISGKTNTVFIETTAEAALKLLDSYIMSTQIYNGQQQLELRPVSVTAAMADTAQYLAKLARLYNCQLEVKMSRKVDLAMAHPLALQSAFLGLGYSFIHSAQTMPADKGLSLPITLNVKQTSQGVKAGIYGHGIEVTSEALRLARLLAGRARQPLTNMLYGGSAGILLADTLFEAMHLKLKTSQLAGRKGLSVTLLPSHQLALL